MPVNPAIIRGLFSPQFDRVDGQHFEKSSGRQPKSQEFYRLSRSTVKCTQKRIKRAFVVISKGKVLERDVVISRYNDNLLRREAQLTAQFMKKRNCNGK